MMHLLQPLLHDRQPMAYSLFTEEVLIHELQHDSCYIGAGGDAGTYSSSSALGSNPTTLWLATDWWNF
jgi:hypothetical protein